VFLRVRAPIHGMTSAAVSCLAWAVLARADVASRRKGAHVLRHTAATQMLRGGVSLPDIGEALRHF
jgi:site-specific recombinase XerD